MKTYFTVEYYDRGKVQGARFTLYEDAITWARQESYYHSTQCHTVKGIIAQFTSGKASAEFAHLDVPG